MMCRKRDGIQVIRQRPVEIVADFAVQVAPRKAEDVPPASRRVEETRSLGLGIRN
jgi:hypothetical protein